MENEVYNYFPKTHSLALPQDEFWPLETTLATRTARAVSQDLPLGGLPLDSMLCCLAILNNF